MSLNDKSYLQDARAWSARAVMLRDRASLMTGPEARALHNQADQAQQLMADAYRRARGRS